MSRAEAEAALDNIARGVTEDGEAGVQRLLERAAKAPPELQSALLEAGARAVLEARR
jgi:hypothetical protein